MAAASVMACLRSQNPHSCIGFMSGAADLETLCRTTLEALSSSFHGRRIQAGFYPYIGLTHTIRRRGLSWLIRISDHCSQAPRAVLEAIILLLACKVLRRKPPIEALYVYERFRKTPEMEERLRSRRLLRGRKRIGDVRGRIHHLEEIGKEVNRLYFSDQVELRRLGWGTRRSWKRLGHYDPVHQTITISPVLDSPKVPRWALSYLLYHEMLHTLFDGISSSRRSRHHTREFRRAEQAFPQYAEARRFLDQFCRTRGRGEMRFDMV